MGSPGAGYWGAHSIRAEMCIRDRAYDMNFHILSFVPGASHSFVETHIQEHGMYIREGEGVYLLDEDWRLIKKGDFVWFGPYCPCLLYTSRCV